MLQDSARSKPLPAILSHTIQSSSKGGNKSRLLATVATHGGKRASFFLILFRRLPYQNIVLEKMKNMPMLVLLFSKFLSTRLGNKPYRTQKA